MKVMNEFTHIDLFSGIGGFGSQWIGERYLGHVLCGLVLLLVSFLWAVDDLSAWILGLPTEYSYLVVPLLLLPLGILMGLPFTLGMRHLLETPVERAYAWAVNGCASVLASIASAQIALSSGIPMIMICAIAAYALAFLTLKAARSAGGS